MALDQEEALTHFALKQQVFRALVTLAEERPLKEVKAADIAERCGISRSAFYRTFSGVRDVIVWHQHFCALMGTYTIGEHLTCREGHRVSLGMLLEGAPLYVNLFKFWSYDYSLPSVNAHANAMFDVLGRHGCERNARLVYEVLGVAHSCHQVVGAWFNNGMDLPLDELVETIVSFYPTSLRAAFDNPLEPLESERLIKRLLAG